MVFHLDFARILFYHVSFLFFFFFFLIIYLYFLIPVVITELYIAIVKLVVPSKIPTKEEIVKIETHSATAEAEISKCSA